MGTLQDNQSLNAEYERNKKEREMKEEIEKLKEDYIATCEQKNKYINSLEQGLNNAEQEIERLNDIIEKDKVLIKEANDRAYSEFEENVKLGNENSSLRFENRKLHSIIKEVREYIEKSKSKLPLGINDFACEMVYSDEVVLANELLEILDKESI